MYGILSLDWLAKDQNAHHKNYRKIVIEWDLPCDTYTSGYHGNQSQVRTNSRCTDSRYTGTETLAESIVIFGLFGSQLQEGRLDDG